MEKQTLMVKDKLASVVPKKLPDETTICVDGDLGTDVITISLVGINDLDLTDAYDSDEAALQLTQTIPAIKLDGPVHISISKPTTTNDCGVYLVRA